MLLRTIKYLKARQIFYQIYYTVKPRKRLTYYTKTTNVLTPLNFCFHYFSSIYYKGNNAFEFLNQAHNFQNAINWNYQNYGKLWNYNLQYFYFLQQKDISDAQKKYWLNDINKWLNSGKLKLEPYPVSLRAINTIRYLSVNKINEQPIADALYGQLNYLYHNLEFHLLGNHLLENAFALLMGGEAYKKNNWSAKAISVLSKELKEQILNDGGHFEQSVMYHQIITFRVLELIEWYRNIQNKDAAFLELIQTIALKMLAWLKTVSFRNGNMPLWNDSTTNFTLSTAELFSFAATLKLAEPKYIALKDSGYRMYGYEDYECIVDAGGMAAFYQPGHSHADALSFILHYKNDPFIVDTGISTYEPGARRNYERSTAAHNTVALNNENQSEIWGSFRVGNRADVNIIYETSSTLKASHNGYKKYDATHVRTFEFNKKSMKILDIIEVSRGEVIAFCYFHFHPSCDITTGEGTMKVNDTTFTFSGAKKINLELYQLAIGFNRTIDAKVGVVEFHHSLETLISFT